ncbi:hypothetical protein GGTG_07809 [Gaeumannomyces tritici R3-111a-1]|uniref:Uncharacterized protein n=1 Tax=Gaeumannomyces tritici (strain R3-111a-1) TaxID=644352 RepID=J3P2R4_GAET3|nr:hypothetical protein GGTG_07809 [Gaeumannomyces tritici R3-111a-1]EJT73956.1 hypothetical protein GGTG_07809 [Gaeumannomyces tritici R3-111a-1]
MACHGDGKACLPFASLEPVDHAKRARRYPSANDEAAASACPRFGKPGATFPLYEEPRIDGEERKERDGYMLETL